VGQGPLIHVVSISNTTAHHSRWDSSGRGISSSQGPLPDNTQQSQQTDIHAPGGFRTRNPSKRAAADLRHRPPGHWDRLYQLINIKVLNYVAYNDTKRACTNRTLPYFFSVSRNSTTSLHTCDKTERTLSTPTFCPY
jgi:hypothetical protein